MGTENEERNRALVLQAFDVLFNKRDFAVIGPHVVVRVEC